MVSEVTPLSEVTPSDGNCFVLSSSQSASVQHLLMWSLIQLQRIDTITTQWWTSKIQNDWSRGRARWWSAIKRSKSLHFRRWHFSLSSSWQIIVCCYRTPFIIDCGVYWWMKSPLMTDEHWWTQLTAFALASSSKGHVYAVRWQVSWLRPNLAIIFLNILTILTKF